MGYRGYSHGETTRDRQFPIYRGVLYLKYYSILSDPFQDWSASATFMPDGNKYSYNYENDKISTVIG